MSDQLPELLSRLVPFDNLTPKNKSIITKYKDMFHYGPTLRSKLMELDALELENYLVWIPFSTFRYVELIGKGAFASVYKASNVRGITRAYQETLVVALKENITKSELVLNTYLTYCVGLPRWSTIRIIGLSQNPKTHRNLLVMEYATGGNLESGMYQTVQANWTNIVHDARELASRLLVIHGIGYVHNDLHPGNIVFHAPDELEERNVYPHIIDVGLSQSREESENLAGIYGRFQYLPPEAWVGGLRTQASDIYALGTLLWQLVVGVSPSFSASPQHRARFDGLREEKIPDAPEAYWDIIRHCWNENPEERPDIDEVVSRLTKLCTELNTRSVFTKRTMEFIASRKAKSSSKSSFKSSLSFKLSSKSSSKSSSFRFVEGTSGSQFYSIEALEQIAQDMLKQEAESANEDPTGSRVPSSFINKISAVIQRNG